MSGCGRSVSDGCRHILRFLENWRWWRLHVNRLFGYRGRRDSRLRGLHEARRRERRGCRLCRLGLFRGQSWLLGAGLCRGPFGEHVAAGQCDVALASEALDELPRDDLFDSARCALQLDAVRALQQRQHFLAARVEELRDLIDTNSGQIVLLQFFFFCCRAFTPRRRKNPLCGLRPDALYLGQRVDTGEGNLFGRIEPGGDQPLQRLVANAGNRE
jgi:hypothetical protein